VKDANVVLYHQELAKLLASVDSAPAVVPATKVAA
jgi:hypothetical protein